MYTSKSYLKITIFFRNKYWVFIYIIYFKLITLCNSTVLCWLNLLKLFFFSLNYLPLPKKYYNFRVFYFHAIFSFRYYIIVSYYSNCSTAVNLIIETPNTFVRLVVAEFLESYILSQQIMSSLRERLSIIQNKNMK